MPATSKVVENASPGPTIPLSNEPSAAVTVWPSSSWFDQSTLPPIGTSTLVGSNARSATVTVAIGAVDATLGDSAGPGEAGTIGAALVAGLGAASRGLRA